MKNVQHIIMLEKYEPPENNNHNLSFKFHEILSKLVSQLSQLLNSTLKILVIFAEANPIMEIQSLSSFQHKLSHSLFNLSFNSELKSRLIDGSPPNFNTFRRFSCRLVENVLPFKQRAELSDNLKPMLSVISQIESSISAFQQAHNILEFIESIYKTFSIFLIYLKKRNRKQETQKQKLQKRFSFKEDVSQKIKSTVSRQTRSKSFQVEPDYQKKLKKLMLGLNSRFKTLDCMDLDYSYFRSSYFQARNSAQFFDEFYERNSLIDQQIKDYEKDYQSYLKRKDNRRTQRSFELSLNKKLSMNKTYDRDRGIDIFIDKLQKRTSLKVNNWASEKERSHRAENKKYSFIEGANQFSMSPLKDKESNKIKYEIKNIIISASKIKMEPHATQKLNIKNTLRQLQASRRKYQKLNEKQFLKNIRQLSHKNEK